MVRLAPDKEGKIPCDCCNHNHMRKDMITKKMYLCNFCKGTGMRTAPNSYEWLYVTYCGLETSIDKPYCNDLDCLPCGEKK